MAPPMDALLELSDATMPSIMPVPYFSGCFEVLLDAEYARTFAALPPMPGSTPMAVPMAEERRKLGICPQNSFKEKPNPLIFNAPRSILLPICMAASPRRLEIMKISVTA